MISRITGMALGRTRTLLGTEPVLMRLATSLVKALNEWAEEEGISRNTLVGRELATAVLNRKKSGSKR